MKLNDIQKQTLASLKKHSDDIYSLSYLADYDLNYLISKEPKNILKIIKAANKIIHRKHGYIPPKLPLGCSTFYCQNKNSEKLFGRNFDYRNSPCIVVKCKPNNGYKSITICDLNFMLYGYKHKVHSKATRLLYAPYMCMDGMNEKGVAISVLELNDSPTKQNNGKCKINTTLIIRYVLDKCSNVDEAIAAFKNFDMYSSLGYNYHFHVVDKSKSVIIEYVKNKLRVIDGNCLTNFYLSTDGNNKKTNGKDRYKIILDELTKHNGILTQEEAFTTLRKVNQHYKFTYKFFIRYYIDTCYNAVYNLNKLEVTVSRNNKYFSFKID